MAINFPDSPTNGQVATIGGKNYTYNSTKNTWTPTQVTEADLSTVGSTTVVATHDLLPASPSAGDMALVSSVNKMYVYFLSGWWLMSSLQNASPSGITGNAALYDLAEDGTPTTVTLSSSDPEGFPIVWTHSVISGSLGGTTVTNVNNVFTITPSTDAADAGTFTLRFAAADGQGGESGSQSNFTLDFVFIVTNSNHTTLLATAVDTSDNNNITDASTNNHSITVNGDAHAGTFSPYRSGGYSLEFNGSNSRMGIQSSNVRIGTSAFTMEFWLYSRAYSGSISSKYSSSNSNGYFLISTTASQGFRCRTRNSGGTQKYVESGSGTYNLNQWNHCIFQRDAAGNLTSYLNGTKYTGDNDGSTNLSATELGLGIFNYIGYEGWHDGYIRDFKLTIGTSALRTASTITVPTEPLASDSNTTAFLGHSPYLTDGSTNSNSIVSTQQLKISPFSPYDYDEYAAADNGGSVYFDGTGDYLTIPDHSSLNFASNDWTIECWIYPRTNAGDCGIWHQSASGGTDWFGLYLDGSFNPKFVLKNNNAEEWAGTAAANTAPQNTWTHIALVRRFGTDIKLYANGKVVHTETQHLNVALENKTYNHVIGYERFVGNGTYFDGLISDFKIDIGTAHYTGEFTPPNAPLSSSGADMHIKGTDASIIDKSQNANLKLVGNTTGSTTQVKFAGSKSMYFDGSGDYIRLEDLGTGALNTTSGFTIESWMYPIEWSSSQGNNALFGLNLISDGENVLVFAAHTGGAIYSGSGYESTSSDVSINQWSHVACVVVGTSTKLYLNGSEVVSRTFANLSGVNWEDCILAIGAEYDTANGGGVGNWFKGYIQDFRITKGLARYTANFTPPTASLEG